MRASLFLMVGAAALCLVIGLLGLAAGCLAQSKTAGLPLTPEDVIWDPRTDEGKQWRDLLEPELMRFAAAVKDSGVLPGLWVDEHDIAVVTFEESGKKLGLEFRFMAYAVPQSPTGGGRIPFARDRSRESSSVPPAFSSLSVDVVTQIARHQQLLEIDEITCFVFEFRWPVALSRFGFTDSRQTFIASEGTGSVVLSSLSVEIPRVIVKSFADSSITASELGRYMKEAGARRRM